MRQRYKWIVGIALTLVAAGGGLYFYARKMAARFSPYIHDQAVQYLSQRFDADVEIGELSIRLPTRSSLQLWLSKGRGAVAAVSAHKVRLHRRQHPGEPDLFKLGKLTFGVDLATLFQDHKEVKLVTIDGLEIHVPPHGDRPAMTQPGGASMVQIDEIHVTHAKLVIHPKDPSRLPLTFDIGRLRLTSNGPDRPMNYVASLENPKPPGHIESTGTFGPWNKADPGSSPLTGEYRFEHADLSSFHAIGGTLESTGTFEGQLNDVQARGEAHVPNFYLKMSGNRMPLLTWFEVRVDGTNGNTIVKPVRAQLGKTRFTTSGSVIKHEDDPARTIAFDAKVAAGHLEDFLLLAMKGRQPLMTGLLNLNTHIQIPPLASKKVVEKLKLKGTFDVKQSHFLNTRIQDRIDELSRKGQGQPSNSAIDEVLSYMGGTFQLENQTIDFSDLNFGVTGADIKLAGFYDLDLERLDFRGTLALNAKVSQTQTGIKHWLLKPVDPFLSKNGAGTFLRIRIAGTREAPKFGLDRNSGKSAGSGR